MDTRIKKGIAGFATAAALAVGGAATDAQINPYEVSAEKYAIVAESVHLEAGENKAEVLRDRPAVKLSRWNGEAELTFEYEKVKAEGERQLLTDRVEWKDGSTEEVHAYPLEAKEGMEDGGFEIEVVVSELPEDLFWEFKIGGAENFRFDYQDPLTAEEIAAGIERPENVEGSYAVFHNQKKNHVEGEINYGSGKAFHVYRPKAIDANGDEVWCKLSYNQPALGVDCRDQAEWFKTAALPITIDPTLGYTSIGGTAGTDGGTTIYAGGITASEGGTLTAITIYCNWNFSGDGTIASAWYTDSSGDPGSKVYTTTGQAVCVSGTPGWRSGTLSGTFTAASYWIGMYQGAGPIRYYWDATGSSDTNTGFVNLPATATAANTNTNRNYSVYVTYTADAPAGSPPVENVWFFH